MHAFAGFTATIAGSFRRKMPTSGDIDILITGKDTAAFHSVVETLKRDYIKDILALGDKKCMCVVRLPRHKVHRRLDILLTSPVEYPYALLYFTGSQGFNIGFRREALKKGYSLSEHGLCPVNAKEREHGLCPVNAKEREHGLCPVNAKEREQSVAANAAKPTDIVSEKDILDFIVIPFVDPENRNENIFQT
jgi:DNA polymerase/3'-5' exonuclease PolX